ncbi:MAG: Mur ligase family protein, partial [Chloroflexota bacterium]|nr:Mur ligase family protein [Chloroflexota bacterium]
MIPTAARLMRPDRLVQHPAYQEALAWLYGLSPNVRTPAEVVADHPRKLPRMRALLDRLGNPERGFDAVLVAGTKGKGSTAALLEAILRAAGLKTGLYTQPHLVSWCERTRLGERAIEPDEAAALMPTVRAAVEAVERERADLGDVTTFEAGTALTLLAFAEHGVELAVVEVGVGGAHDATNVLEPLVAVLAPVSLDHMVTLGPTLAAIAREKVGIFRPGGRAVVGPQSPEALTVVEQVAAAQGTRLELVGREWHWWPTEGEPATGRFAIAGPGVRLDDLSIPLVGRHQRDNATLALAAAHALALLSSHSPRWRKGPGDGGGPDGAGEALPLGGGGLGEGDPIRRGLAAVEWPGRFQVLRERPRVVVDGAHNDDSARRLAEAYRDVFGMRHCHL